MFMTLSINPKSGPWLKMAGRYYAVTGWFSSYDECNAWLADNPGHGVILVRYGSVATANLSDKGVRA